MAAARSAARQDAWITALALIGLLVWEASGLDLMQLQSQVRQAIVEHEPRILADSLVVEVVTSNAQLDHHNLVGFRISGQLWAQPVPLELLLHTDIDLETGRVAVRELDR